jgi:hypothetical protein
MSGTLKKEKTKEDTGQHMTPSPVDRGGIVLLSNLPLLCPVLPVLRELPLFVMNTSPEQLKATHIKGFLVY